MKKWLVAVSGGCDSMSLLDMCVKNNIEVEVAHVNYQKRISAIRDEELVKNYCLTHGIKVHVAYCDPHYKGNFQAYARDFRYQFFKDCIEKNQLEGVLVAHQMDDLLETYLIQKQRGSEPDYYGLREDTYRNGIRIVRPLLYMTKKQCYEYCYDHEVPFGEDESNFSNDYLRNRLRKEVVDTWSQYKRDSVLEEIIERNREKIKGTEKIWKDVEKLEEDGDIQTLLDSCDPCLVLRTYLNNHQKGYHTSLRYLKMIIDKLKESKENLTFDIDENTRLMSSYGKLEIVEDIEYEYVFHTLAEFECPYFSIRTEGRGVEAVTLSEDDFPITIRSPKNNDEIKLRFGTKKISRFFIDRKISHKNRLIWPIVVNSKGNVVLVPEIGCDVEHYTNKPNCFVVK